jgi:SulP family sulfate permease
MLQVVFLVVPALLMAALLRFIPLSVLSALILSTVFRMMNWQEILSLIKAPRIDVAAWVATSLLIIVTDLPMAIALGMLIGIFLYIRSKPAVPSKA